MERAHCMLRRHARAKGLQMWQSTQVRSNRMESSRTDSDDALASQVSWEPLKPGGANFKTHDFEVTPTHMAVRRSAGGIGFALCFAGPGALFVLVGLHVLVNLRDPGGLAFALIGGLFVAVGVFLLRSGSRVTFDLHAGVYYVGKAYRPGVLSREQQGPVSAIHAVQLLQERIRSSSRSGGRSTYTSYEMNLVFTDGERLNVLDHGKAEAVLEAAQQLASALQVPIWQERAEAAPIPSAATRSSRGPARDEWK
jgi:hypothetical protein